MKTCLPLFILMCVVAVHSAPCLPVLPIPGHNLPNKHKDDKDCKEEKHKDEDCDEHKHDKDDCEEDKHPDKDDCEKDKHHDKDDCDKDKIFENLDIIL